MKKIPSLLIVADRGRLVAYRTDNGRVPKVLTAIDFYEAHRRMSETFTDRAGSFPDAGTAGHGNASAERLSLMEELDTRSLRRVAEGIGSVLSEQQPETWAFAAPAEINQAILDELDAHLVGQIELNIRRDLTHTPAADLMGHLNRAREGA